MRIWLLTSELPDEFAGGIARYIHNLAFPLGVAGHEVTMIARSQQERDEQLAPNVRLIGFVSGYEQRHEFCRSNEPDDHPAYPYNVISYEAALSYQMAAVVLDLLKKLPPPDIIECQEYAALPYYLLQRKLTESNALRDIPILVHLHSPFFEIMRVNQEPRYRFPKYWLGQMEKFCLLAADALLSPSHFLARSVEQTLERQLKTTVIPYPLLVQNDSPPTVTTAKNIVYVGRLEIRKGVLSLIKACSNLWASGVDFQLTLIGGDTRFSPKNMTVGEFIRTRYAPWIVSGQLNLLGQMSHLAVQTRIREAWAVTVPSLWENFPNTCLEAMSLGQVVLVSHSGGQAEMVESDSQNGFIFDWNIPGNFEQKLSQILSLSGDERLVIGQNAQTRIRRLCAPEVIIPQRVRHYETVITGHQPHRSFPTMQAKKGIELRRATEEQASLLSVIVPFYNLGNYLEETLNSILASTYKPLEIIVIDDGSTDLSSLTRLQQLEAKRVSNLSVIRTENQGLAAARNTGALAAKGEFITFVDADDLVDPDFFQQAINVLQHYHNVSFVYSWLRFFEGSSGIWPTWNAEFPYLLGHNMLSAFAVVRRSHFLAYAQNKPEIAYSLEDYEGWLNLVAAGGVGVSLPFPLVRYRVRSGSMYRNSNPAQQIYLYDLITREHQELYREWGVELFNLQNANGSGRLWNNPMVALPNSPQITVEEGQISFENEQVAQEFFNHLSAYEMSRRMPTQRMIQTLFFKIANRPGLNWLYRFRPLGKRVLGGR